MENENDSFPLFDPDGEMDEEKAEEAARLLRKLDQDRVNDARAAWNEMYGFDHECSCASDMEEDRTLTIPFCYAEACDNAFMSLRRVRAFLYAIHTSPSENPRVLKALAGEAFYEGQ